MDSRRRRRDAFLEHARAEEGIDEGALPGVELADDDEQEELVELPRGVGEGLRVGRCGRDRRERCLADRTGVAAPP